MPNLSLQPSTVKHEPLDPAQEIMRLEALKRIRQDRLYQLNLAADEAATHGRDALAAEAACIARQIGKARNRRAHLS